jgi:hypothetical protein
MRIANKPQTQTLKMNAPTEAPATRRGGCATPHAQDGFVTSCAKPPPPHGLSLAFVSQVQKMGTKQLKQLEQSLKMELFSAKLSGNYRRVGDLQAKLGHVQQQLQVKGAQEELKTRFAYQREAKGMSNEQLSSARSTESLNLFMSKLRGDAAGVKEATMKLGILDQEISSREHELNEFQETLDATPNEGLEELGTTLMEGLDEALGDPDATPAQQQSAFNKLSAFLGTFLQRFLGQGFESMPGLGNFHGLPPFNPTHPQRPSILPPPPQPMQVGQAQNGVHGAQAVVPHRVEAAAVKPPPPDVGRILAGVFTGGLSELFNGGK